MSLFKHESLEDKRIRLKEKEEKRQQKLIAKQEKEKEQIRAWINDHNLTGIREDSYAKVKDAKSWFHGQSVGTLLTGEAKIGQGIFNLLEGISEQNWLIIKQNDQLRTQNDEIIKLLQKLNNKNN